MISGFLPRMSLQEYINVSIKKINKIKLLKLLFFLSNKGIFSKLK